MTFPVIKIISGPSPTMIGVQNAATDGLAPLISSLNATADLCPFDPQELFGFLHFRLHTASQAKRREGWLGGKFFNKASGQSADYIPASGTHLKQILSAAGISTPEFVVAQGQYELRLDYAEKAYEQIEKMQD